MNNTKYEGGFKKTHVLIISWIAIRIDILISTIQV